MRQRDIPSFIRTTISISPWYFVLMAGGVILAFTVGSELPRITSIFLYYAATFVLVFLLSGLYQAAVMKSLLMKKKEKVSSYAKRVKEGIIAPFSDWYLAFEPFIWFHWIWLGTSKKARAVFFLGVILVFSLTMYEVAST